MELTIVMAIIALLSTLFWGNFMSTIFKGKDSRRKQDLVQITKALELYYNDVRAYPMPPLPFNQVFTNPVESSIIYMQKLPQDPSSPNRSYCYDSDGTFYRLFANLENMKDPSVMQTPVTCISDGQNYNYYISSPNVN